MTDTLRTRIAAAMTDYLNGVLIIDTGELADYLIRELGLSLQLDTDPEDLFVPTRHHRYVTEWEPD